MGHLHPRATASVESMLAGVVTTTMATTAAVVIAICLLWQLVRLSPRSKKS